MRPAFGFVFLATRDGPVSLGDVAELLGVTKQAASKLVDSMQAAGYAERVADPDDARGRRVRLTARGRRALDAVEQIYRALETEWAALIGPRRLESLRRDLTHVLQARNDGELPPVRPTW